MARFFKPKAEVSFANLDLQYKSTRSKIFRCRISQMALDSERSKWIVKAMLAVDDLMAIGYLNWRLMNEMREILEHGELPESALTHVTYAHAMLHRRWVFRMACVSIDDMIKLFRKLQKQASLVDIFKKPGIAKQARLVKNLLDKQREEHINGMRNNVAAHIDDQGKISNAIIDLSNRTSSVKCELSTKPFGTRYFVAEDILANAALGTVWGLSGSTEQIDSDANKILEGFSELWSSLLVFFDLFSQTCVEEFDLAS